MITRLAIEALPPSPLQKFMARNRAAIEDYSVVPDTRLKNLYGEAEKRRHYINPEYFGRTSYRALVPDISAMERRYGVRRVRHAGTLPWTIEDVSTQVGGAWKNGDCAGVLRLSGYLSHYVGDLSQPLHTTRFFDGYVPSDSGMHARFELAVDRSNRSIEAAARAGVHAQKLSSVWDLVIEGLRESNSHVAEVVAADRAARAVSGANERAYETALMRQEQSLIAKQIADSASRLSSIWLYEWEQAGRPASCAAGSPIGRGRRAKLGAGLFFLQHSNSGLVQQTPYR
jgi:hypothetical protein